jgi:hypothetical protein
MLVFDARGTPQDACLGNVKDGIGQRQGPKDKGKTDPRCHGKEQKAYAKTNQDNASYDEGVIVWRQISSQLDHVSLIVHVVRPLCKLWQDVRAETKEFDLSWACMSVIIVLSALSTATVTAVGKPFFVDVSLFFGGAIARRSEKDTRTPSLLRFLYTSEIK